MNSWIFSRDVKCLKIDSNYEFLDFSWDCQFHKSYFVCWNINDSRENPDPRLVVIFEARKSKNSPNSSYSSNFQVVWMHFSKSDLFVAKNIFEQMKIKDRCFYLRINSILTIVPKSKNSLFYVRIWDLGNTRLLSYLKH